jgi:glycosyltransferase involved in cell wall biosynthesis
MALNAGIDIARGAFIAVMGGDDVSEPIRIAQQLEHIQNGSADLVFCLPRLINYHGATLLENECQLLFSGAVSLSQSARYAKMFYEGNHLCAPSMLAKREVFQRVGLFHPGLLQLQDFEYWIRALGFGLKFAVSEERLVRYRRHSQNLSHPKRDNIVARESIYVWDRFFDGADPTIVRETFADMLDPIEKSRPLRLEEIGLIYTSHESSEVRELGVRRLIESRRASGSFPLRQPDELLDFGTFRDALEAE